MKEYFDRHKLLGDIDIVTLDRGRTKEWNSFSRAPLTGEPVSQEGRLYGRINPKLEAMRANL